MTVERERYVLLIEPEREVARRVEALLGGAATPYRVTRAESAGTGLARSEPDAVLVGPGALRDPALRKVRESSRDVALVALGGPTELENVEWLGEDEWTPAALDRCLRHAMERSHFARELHHLIAERLAGEESMRNIVSNLADGVVVTSPGGGVLYVNPAAEALLEDGRGRLVGADLPFPLPEGEAEAEVDLPGPSGPRSLAVGAVPVDWEGRPAVAVTLRDETGRRASERALRESERRVMQAQKMEAIGRLAGGVAHDFNNLLTAISGYSELVLGELPPDGPSRTDMIEIRKAAERASTLTRQLLAFSRRQVLQPAVLDLNETVTELQKLLRRVLGEDIELCCHLAPGAARVKADPGRIEQIVLDLAVNARETMPTGGKLTVETGVVTLEEPRDHGEFLVPSGTYTSLAVTDTGAGMDAETAKHVFEPFFTTKEEGTGLGLSTVYGTVKQSNGFVWVASEPGRGTRFEIYLPSTGEAVAVEAALPEPPRGQETILLAEDERPVRELARRILEREGYRVLPASSGLEALRLSSEYPGGIDLLLTDVVMPGVGGVEAADAIRAERPGVGLLFLSGYSDRIVAENGKLDSGYTYLAKPFSGSTLVRTVRNVLDGRTVRS